MYEVVNRRMQRLLAFASASTGFAHASQGAVTAGTGAQLIIAAYPDGALVDGLYVENPESETVTLTTNTASTNPRIDRLVMRLDMGAQTIAPFQIVGTPAASPQAPPLTQNATVFDMPLCRYTVPGSASAQNPGSIVDERRYLDLPYCQAKQDTQQIIPINAWTAIALDGESLDSHGWHSPTTNNSRVTASGACVVRVSGSVPWAASPGTAVGVMGARLTKNGTPLDNGGGYALNEAGELGLTAHTPSPLVQLATNDYLQLEAFQPFSSLGGGLSTRVAAYSRATLSVEVIRWL